MDCSRPRISLMAMSDVDMVGSSSLRIAAATQAQAIMLGGHMVNLYSRAQRAM